MLANYYKITIPKESLNEAIHQMCKVQNHLKNNAIFTKTECQNTGY